MEFTVKKKKSKTLYKKLSGNQKLHIKQSITYKDKYRKKLHHQVYRLYDYVIH